MGIDGVRDLRRGRVRRLTRSDIDRGYVFVSKDLRIGDALDIADFTAIAWGVVLEHRHLSSAGRVFIPKELMARNIGSGKVVVRILDFKTVAIDAAREDGSS